MYVVAFSPDNHLEDVSMQQVKGMISRDDKVSTRLVDVNEELGHKHEDTEGNQKAS